VQIEDVNLEVTAQPVPLNPGVRFQVDSLKLAAILLNTGAFLVHTSEHEMISQVHIEVSTVKINVTGIPDELPEDQMRDKLELSFCRSRNGGGEVESVDYDKPSRSAVITFVEAGGTHALQKLTNTLPFQLFSATSEIMPILLLLFEIY
jgi:hypothetical protein